MMKHVIILFLSLTLLSSNVFAASFIEQVKTLDTLNDDLGIRILIKKNFKRKLSIKEWDEVRKILKRRYAVGIDAVIAWDRQISIQNTNLDEVSDSFQKLIEEADRLMLEKKFNEALEKYQEVAKLAKASSGGKIEKNNYNFYFNILHQIGRALYSLKRFNEAIEVYSWIPPVYFMSRQVMFEKMWAGFRANRYDIALGAIASQKSAYFSTYADPEAYLVQIYILKRLCRTTDMERVVRTIKKYNDDLKNDRVSILDWAKSDMLRMSLINLMTQTASEKALEIVPQSERVAEKSSIMNVMKLKYQAEKPVIINQLDKILGYAYLVLSEDQKILSPVSNLPESKVLEKRGYEFWPSDTGEEWFDEIGSHLFIGESKCTKSPKK